MVYRFTWWERFKWMELPYATTGLVWNSMMSMAGGWFFLMINEAFRLGDHDFRLPGLGSYMSVAVHEGKPLAMTLAVVAMMLMIVALDQLLWRPVVVWAQRFRVEETTAAETSRSWFLDFVRRSGFVRRFRYWRRSRSRHHGGRTPAAECGPRSVSAARAPHGLPRSSRRRLLACSLATIGWGAFRLVHLLAQLPLSHWGTLSLAGGLTLGRVLVSTAVGTAWAVPAGLAIGLSPLLSRLLQPVAQVMASFPAPMLFPVAIALFHAAGLGLGAGSIVLMLLGTQWYILFNVIAGASSVPSDLKEAVVAFRMTRRRALLDALPARDLPVPGDGMGDGGGRSLEREHRRGVRDLQGRDPLDLRAGRGGERGRGAGAVRGAGRRPSWSCP